MAPVKETHTLRRALWKLNGIAWSCQRHVALWGLSVGHDCQAPGGPYRDGQIFQVARPAYVEQSVFVPFPS